MLKVAIHENVQLHKVTKNDKGTLVVGLKKANPDPLAGFNDTQDTAEGDQEFLFLTPYATAYGGDLDTPENNSQKIKDFKNQLTHFLLGYTTSDKIKWDATKDTGIDRSNFNEKMTQQRTVDLMYKNLVDQFIEQITPHIGPNSPLFRCLLIRTNRLKHFSTFRKKFLDENPFWEPMTVSKEQSKLKYTAWEITNKYNSGERVTEADTVSEEQSAEAHDVLAG
jgi:hypothetical protein